MVDAEQIQSFTKMSVLKKSDSQNDGWSSSTTSRLRAREIINLCLLSFILFSKGTVAHSEDPSSFSYIQVDQCTLVCVTSLIPLNWHLFRS